MKKDGTPNYKAMLIVLTAVYGGYVLAGSGWFAFIWLYFTWGLNLALLGLIVLLFLYLGLVCVAVRCALPIKLWAKSLPIRLAVYIIVPLFFRWAHLSPTAGMSLLSALLIEPLDLPEWTCVLFTALEMVVFELLGIGISALARTIKRKWNERYGGIPF